MATLFQAIIGRNSVLWVGTEGLLHQRGTNFFRGFPKKHLRIVDLVYYVLWGPRNFPPPFFYSCFTGKG